MLLAVQDQADIDVEQAQETALAGIVVETPVTNQQGIVVADISRTIVVRNGRPS